MKKCKDCPAFEPIRKVVNGCNGYCFEYNSAYGRVLVNGEWDEDACPFLQRYLNEEFGLENDETGEEYFTDKAVSDDLWDTWDTYVADSHIPYKTWLKLKGYTDPMLEG